MNTDVVAHPTSGPAPLSDAERPHHPFSPSKLQYLEANPNYVGEEREKPLEASLRGTAQHNAAEEHADIDDPSLEDDEAEAVAMCKAFREDLIARYPGCTVIKEVYLPIDDKVLRFKGVDHVGTTAGYVDLAVVSADGTEAEIADWKFGLWSVEPAENNLQGIAYMLGLFKKYPTLKKVTVNFLLPHREEHDFHTFTADQFEALYLRICTIVARAHKAQSEADFSQCRVMAPSCLFCGNKAVCPSLATFALKIGKKFAPLSIPENVSPTTFSDVTQSSQTMTTAQLMEAWGKAMRAQITARTVEDDNWMPEGYVLRSRANREIADEKKVIEMAEAEGLSKDKVDACRSLSMTPVYKLIRATAERGAKEAAEDNFRNKLVEAGAIVEGNPTIFLERLRS